MTDVHDNLPTWSRCAARSLDLLLESFLIGLFFSFYVASIYPEYLDWVGKPGHNTLVGIIVAPFAFVLDALIYAVFGNTFGKKIMGFSIQKSSGDKLTVYEYFVRNMKVWVLGNGLGLPLIAVLANAAQFRAIKTKGAALYDLNSDTVFVGKPPHVLLTSVVYLITFVFAIGMAVLARH